MRYFSKIQINTDALDANQLARVTGQDNYRDHQLIWRLFPRRPDAKRDFLFRREQMEGWPCFYVVSVIEPCDESEMWQVETKPYTPQVHRGQRLAFNVRVNAVVTRWGEDEGKRRQVRHDVVMDAKKTMRYSELARSERPNQSDLVQDAGVAWMKARCGGWGFSVKLGAVRVDGYRQHLVFKRGQGRPVRFSTLDYNGLLTVEDPDRFGQTLLQGIGKSRGLGCGLMLVKPVRN